jgi:cell division protein FtsB
MLDSPVAGRGLSVFILRFLSPGRFLLAATLIVAGYLIYSAGGSLLHSYQLQGDEAELRAQIEDLRMQQDQLQQVRDYLRTDEYVEFMARRVFGLVKPGELLVIVDAPKPAVTQQAGVPSEFALGETWWQRLFGSSR